MFSFQAAPTWKKKKFENEKLFEVTIPTPWGFAAIISMYEAKGKPYTPPGKGGDGGRGGIGGIEGQTFLIGANGYVPKFHIINERGI